MEIQNQLSESIKQLSPERLQVVADFAAFLANAESEAATQELLSIAGLLDRIKQGSDPKVVKRVKRLQYGNYSHV